MAQEEEWQALREENRLLKALVAELLPLKEHFRASLRLPGLFQQKRSQGKLLEEKIIAFAQNCGFLEQAIGQNKVVPWQPTMVEPH